MSEYYIHVVNFFFVTKCNGKFSMVSGWQTSSRANLALEFQLRMDLLLRAMKPNIPMLFESLVGLVVVLGDGSIEIKKEFKKIIDARNSIKLSEIKN